MKKIDILFSAGLASMLLASFVVAEEPESGTLSSKESRYRSEEFITEDTYETNQQDYSYTSQPLELTNDIALTASRQFELNPLSDDGLGYASVVMKYASVSDDIYVQVDNRYLPWVIDEIGIDRYLSELMLASFVVGNVKRQLEMNIKQDQPAYGLKMMVHVYRQLRKEDRVDAIETLEMWQTFSDAELEDFVRGVDVVAKRKQNNYQPKQASKPKVQEPVKQQIAQTDVRPKEQEEQEDTIEVAQSEALKDTVTTEPSQIEASAKVIGDGYADSVGDYHFVSEGSFSDSLPGRLLRYQSLLDEKRVIDVSIYPLADFYQGHEIKKIIKHQFGSIKNAIYRAEKMGIYKNVNLLSENVIRSGKVEHPIYQALFSVKKLDRDLYALLFVTYHQGMWIKIRANHERSRIFTPETYLHEEAQALIEGIDVEALFKR